MNPVRIRGIEYPSQSAAAMALGISPSAIAKALDQGRIDTCGLSRRGGRPCRPCHFRGELYPSVTAAAKAHGVGTMTIWRDLKRRREA